MSKDKSAAQGSQESEISSLHLQELSDLSDRESIVFGRVGKSFVVKCVYYVSSDSKVDSSMTVHDLKQLPAAIIAVRAAVSKLANAS